MSTSPYKVHLFETETTWSIRINRDGTKIDSDFDIGVDFRNDGKKIPKDVIIKIADFLVECLDKKDKKLVEINYRDGTVEIVNPSKLNREQKRKILFAN